MQNVESLPGTSVNHLAEVLCIKGSMSNAELSQRIRQGVTHIYQENHRQNKGAPETLFYLHVTAPVAFQMDLFIIIRSFLSSHPELVLEDSDLALTAIFEGWSNALLWGTLELPPMNSRDLDPHFEKILAQRLRQVKYAQRFVTLTINKFLDNLVVSIEDEGTHRPFNWEQACAMSSDVYKGLSIIHNCCREVDFDATSKTLRMTFKLV